MEAIQGQAARAEFSLRDFVNTPDNDPDGFSAALRIQHVAEAMKVVRDLCLEIYQTPGQGANPDLNAIEIGSLLGTFAYVLDMQERRLCATCRDGEK